MVVHSLVLATLFAVTELVAVLDGDRPRAEVLAKALRDGGFTVETVSPGELSVADERYVAIAIAEASSASAECVRKVVGWIRRGKPALVLGAPLNGIARPPVPRAFAPIAKVKHWVFDHGENGSATGTIEECGGDILHVTFSKLVDWSVFNSERGLKLFAPGADALVFKGRAKDDATDVQFELDDTDGARWIAVVRLEKEWNEYALYPEDFKRWTSPKATELDYAKVDRIAIAISPAVPMMRGRSADLEIKGLASAKDPDPTWRQEIVQFQDALYPHWKFYDAGAYFAPVPRADGQGAFRALRWRLIGGGEARWTFLDRVPGSPERAFVATGWKNAADGAADLPSAVRDLRRLMDEPTLFAAGTRQMAYWPGEKIELGAEWRSGAKRGAKVELSVADPAGRCVFRREHMIVLGAPNAWKETWTAPEACGVYHVEVACGADKIAHDFLVMKNCCDQKENFVAVKDGRFYVDGREWHPVGINYVPRYSAGLNPEDYRDAWLNDDFYAQRTVDEDLQHIAEMGCTFVAIQTPHPTDTRNLADFLRLSRKHGLKVNLFVRELDPRYKNREEKTWRKRARDIMLKNDSTLFAYDIAWEVGQKVFAEPARKGRELSLAWEDWIDEEYGDLITAEKEWGCDVWRGKDGRITGPDQKMLREDGPWIRQTVAYRRFMDDYSSRAWNRTCRLVKEEDANHLISYRQGNTCPHDFTFTGPVRHLDFIAPEGYMVADNAHGEDVIGWVTQYAAAASGGKPVLWMEFALSAWDNIAQRTVSKRLDEAAAYGERFYRTGLEAGAAGMTPWWWPGGFRYTECSDCGIVEPDGRERPMAQLLREYASRYRRDGREYNPDVWMDFDRDVHAGGYWRAALNEGAEEWRKAKADGRRLGIRLAGEGSDSKMCEKRFLRSEFDRLEVLRNGKELHIVAEVGNTGMATWLPAAVGKGGVSLVVRASRGKVLARFPLMRAVKRFESSGMIEGKVTLETTLSAEFEFRLEAEGRATFGERRRILLPLKTASTENI